MSSLREYFAARFLYRYAGEETKRFDRVEVLRELLRRPYWLNTARFYGGNAEVGDLSVLADGIIEELANSGAPCGHRGMDAAHQRCFRQPSAVGPRGAVQPVR